MEISQTKSRKIKYKIHSCSSQSSSYLPENIIEDKPSDQYSRWSSDTNSPHQYIILFLERPAIVTHIKFGKFEKTHVCNLKKFQVFGGLEEDNMLELLDSGLKNDASNETFQLRYQLHGQPFPCQYIKIVPVQSWGPSFNFSIWFVALEGDDSKDTVQRTIRWHRDFKEKETIRLCLKHFRQHNYLEAFESLQKKTKIQLEHPLLTELHSVLVRDGDYHRTEQLIESCSADEVFANHLSRQQPRPVWSALIIPEQITTTPPSPSPPLLEDSDIQMKTGEEYQSDVEHPLSQPSRRGGHQLVIDTVGQSIYLFGGWNGTKDLADFWVYSVATARWTLLSSDTESEGGPPPRSCHKMVLDPTYRQITDDTSAMGGPSLIFDHQMCLDFEKRDIYVFGGQSLVVYPVSEETTPQQRPSTTSDKKFSGLYVYHVPNNTWRLLLDDGEFPGPSISPVRSRTGHSMLFNTKDRNLYIFGGQRKRDEYLNDFFTYHVDTSEVKFLSEGNMMGESAIPAVGYTQRATIDCKRNEIHVMTGLNKDKDKDKRSREGRVSNSFWVFDINSSRWSVVYKNENNEPGYWDSRQAIEPRPRYAHQLVYDEELGVHFMFGGNPGGKEGKDGKVRLGDFWQLSLVRPRKSDFDRQVRLLIRKTKFQELKSEPLTALSFLQGEVSSCVDHTDPVEEKQFQLLVGTIFSQDPDVSIHSLRSDLFDDLVTYFPLDMTQPSGNLLDLIPLESGKQTNLPGLINPIILK